LVLPVKGGPGAKSRLSALSLPGLALAVALDCLEAALGCDAVARVLVVSGDRAVRAAATALGAATLDDPGAGLDAAAHAGLSTLAGQRPVAPRAVLLADLPCLRPDDLGAALGAAGAALATGHAAAVVPDAGGRGTVLLVEGPGPVRTTAFGAGSAGAHERGGAVRLALDLPRLRRDVDTVDDLAEALALGVGPRTARVLDRAALGPAGFTPRRAPSG